MTIDEALATLSPDTQARPAVRQMPEAADRCAASRSGMIVRYARPSAPALRTIFDALFEQTRAFVEAAPRLALRRGAVVRRVLAALKEQP